MRLPKHKDKFEVCFNTIFTFFKDFAELHRESTLTHVQNKTFRWLRENGRAHSFLPHVRFINKAG